ncbi:MAG: hypothetical protein ABI475_01920 [Methylophilaceae bacterium]
MFTLTISLDSLAVYIVVADIVILLTYILYIFHKKRRLNKSIENITEFITEYFRNSGAEVQVACYKVEGNNHFVIFIESQPLKRFRYSNILESNLISHIFKITGNVVEKVYWRFPVPLHNDAMTTLDGDNLSSDDLYIVEGHALAKAQAEYKVSEVSWDEFESLKKENT